MRFGVAVDLWAKGDRADPTRENATESGGQAARTGASSSQRASQSSQGSPEASHRRPGREDRRHHRPDEAEQAGRRAASRSSRQQAGWTPPRPARIREAHQDEGSHRWHTAAPAQRPTRRPPGCPAGGAVRTDPLD